MRSGVTLPPGSGRLLTNRDGYERRYWNLDVVATKRLAFGTRHRDSSGSVLIDRDLDASRFPSPRFVDLRLEKRLTLGGVRATLDFDVFNALISASTLRQFSDATATTFRSPLEIVAPRLVRLGLRLQF